MPTQQLAYDVIASTMIAIDLLGTSRGASVARECTSRAASGVLGVEAALLGPLVHGAHVL